MALTNPSEDFAVSTPDAMIVGGGICGLSTAFALTRLGLAVQVLEQAPAFEEGDAGIQVSPNCTRILHDYGFLNEAIVPGPH